MEEQCSSANREASAPFEQVPIDAPPDSPFLHPLQYIAAYEDVEFPSTLGFPGGKGRPGRIDGGMEIYFTCGSGLKPPDDGDDIALIHPSAHEVAIYPVGEDKTVLVKLLPHGPREEMENHCPRRFSKQSSCFCPEGSTQIIPGHTHAAYPELLSQLQRSFKDNRMYMHVEMAVDV